MNILLVDDHYMAVEFYYNYLNDFFSTESSLTVFKAFNCEQAYNIIMDPIEVRPLDWAFIDYRLPAFYDQNLNSGSDIAILARRRYPNCKIVIITRHTEALIVYDILWNSHPEGLAAKCDVNFETFPVMIEKIRFGSYYKSKTIEISACKILEEKILVDSINRKIISLILQGFKIKDLHTKIDLKPSTIHRRILNINKALKIPDDNNLIRELIDRGYVNSIYPG